jgi:peptidyl-prolyl cis-trans isomerase D
MFKFLRKGATSLLAKIFLAVITIVFVFWGIGTFTAGRRDLVAEVNGIPITLREFREFYNFQLFQLRQTFGELSQEDLKKLNFKEQILQSIAQAKLLEKKAEEMGIKITPLEIGYAISRIPSFQVNGKFNPTKYKLVLREIGITSEFFEKLIKQDLLRKKIELLLTSPLIVSKEEAREFLKFFKQKLDFIEASIPLSSCEKEVKVTEKKLKNYYLTHRDIYVEPEKVKIAYLFFPYKGKVKVTEEEIKNYYETHLDEFKEPFRVKLRRIFVPVIGKDSFKQAEKIKKSLKSIKDFEKFGYKQGIWVNEEQIPPDLLPLLKSAKKGAIIGPVKVGGGYFILGIEDIKPTRLLKLDEVKAKIRKKLEEEKIKEQVKDRAVEIYGKVVEENGLTAWAKKYKKELKYTDWMKRDQLLRLIPSFSAINKIFKTTKGDYLSPIETSKGIYLVEIVDKKPPRTLKFEEVKERVKKDFLKDEGKKVCEAKSQKLISEIKKSKNFLQTLFKKAGFRFKELKLMREDFRNYYSPEIAEVLENTGKPGLIERYFWDGEFYKIFYIKKIKPFNGKITQQELDKISRQLLVEKRRKFLETWFRDLRESANLKIYPLFKNL